MLGCRVCANSLYGRERCSLGHPLIHAEAFMKKLVLIFILASASATIASQRAKDSEAARWEHEAQNVTIIRDDWGIAHVYGKTDADAVFGMIYAQAEDDFNRVETNYINAMGWLAEPKARLKINRTLGISPSHNSKPFTAKFP